MTHEAAWKVFTETGEPLAYLLYRCGEKAAQGDSVSGE